MTSYEQAASWIVTWIKDRHHNPTEFTQDLPALLETGVEYRKELLQKRAENPEVQIPTTTIMAKCVFDFGDFSHVSGPDKQPNDADYVFHLTLRLLAACCTNDSIPIIIPRVLLNNLAIKMSTKELEMDKDLHPRWAMEVFGQVRSDLIPDFITKLNLSSNVTPEILIDIAKNQFKSNRFNDCALMIVRYNFHEHFDLQTIMVRLVDLNKLETAKLLIQNNDELKKELIRLLSTNENCKKATQLVKDFKMKIDDFPELKERIMKNSMRYYLGRNLYKKQNQTDFMSLDRVEDLLSGIKQMLSYLVEDLVHKGKMHEAKGIMLRNKVESHVRPEILD